MWFAAILVAFAVTASASSIPSNESQSYIESGLNDDFAEINLDSEDFEDYDDDLANSEAWTGPLNGNSFFIYNKYYNRARLAQYKTRIITYELHLAVDQIWVLEESSRHRGYYYINNAYHKGYRLAKYASRDGAITVYNGQYHDDQLWRFVKEGNYYRIYNKVYTTAKLAKWGKKDSQITTYDGRRYDDQLWKLVPRFKATASERVLWSIDNRQGTKPVTSMIKIIRGVRLTNSRTLSTKVGLESSLKASVSAGARGFSAGLESTLKFYREITHSISSSQERFWTKEVTRTYTAPAGTFYQVVQTVLHFTSPFSRDNCSLYNHERIKQKRRKNIPKKPTCG